MPFRRHDGRPPEGLRPLRITPGCLKHAEGSALVEFGDNRVICAVSIEDRVPAWLKDSGSGWLSAEYAMLPRATHTRSARESVLGKVGGRTTEISRLIGRSLRAVVDLTVLPDKTLTVDCDVIQADGGTRTASINGAYVALVHALQRLREKGALEVWPLGDSVAAVSVAVLGGAVCLDPDYLEDSQAEVDMNYVMTGGGKYVEVQGTAEKTPFDSEQMDRMAQLARQGISAITRIQREAIAAFLGESAGR